MNPPRPLHGRHAAAITALIIAGSLAWVGRAGQPAQPPRAGQEAAAPRQEASPSASPGETPTAGATLPGQASLRLSMPLLYLPATPTAPPATPTAWPKPPVQQLTEDIQAVAAGGGYAYLGTRGGLIVVDVRDPAQPKPVGRVGFGWPVAVRAVGLRWLGARVVVLGLDERADHNTTQPGSFLATVDVRDPFKPRLLQLLPQREVSFGLDQAGDVLVLAGFHRQACDGTGDGGLLVYDVGMDGRLTRIACHPLVGVSPLAVGAEGSEVVLTAISTPDEGRQSVHWFSLTDPRRPLLRRSEATPRGGTLFHTVRQQGLSVFGGPGSNRLLIEQAPQGQSVTQLRPVAMGDDPSCGLSGIAKLDGDWFIRMDHYCEVPTLIRWSGKIHEPTPRGELDRIVIDGQVDLQPREYDSGAWNSMAAADGLVFLADQLHGGILTIIDVRGGGTPRIVGRLD